MVKFEAPKEPPIQGEIQMAQQFELTFFLRSDISTNGVSEDGEVLYDLSWYVVAECETTGQRWAHERVFRTRASSDAPARAVTLLEKIRAATDVKPFMSKHWLPTYPRYGSPAYDGSEEAMWEMKTHSF